MAPYNWLYLFLLFNMIMIYLTAHNYYTNPNMNQSITPLMFKKINFKWKW